MRLVDAFPDWLAEKCRVQGISGAITTLSAMGDTPAAQIVYQNYGARLSAWGTTTLGTPSNTLTNAATARVSIAVLSV
jgi:hypothetical protein